MYAQSDSEFSSVPGFGMLARDQEQFRITLVRSWVFACGALIGVVFRGHPCCLLHRWAKLAVQHTYSRLQKAGTVM